MIRTEVNARARSKKGLPLRIFLMTGVVRSAEQQRRPLNHWPALDLFGTKTVEGQLRMNQLYKVRIVLWKNTDVLSAAMNMIPQKVILQMM